MTIQPQAGVIAWPFDRDLLMEPSIDQLSTLPPAFVALNRDRRPIDPATGYGLKGWQHTRMSAAEICESGDHFAGLGLLTGAPSNLLVIDFDDQAAIDEGITLGCNPWTVETWRVVRLNDLTRVKVFFLISTDEAKEFPTLHLKEEHGLSIDVLSTGAQAAVYGQHQSGVHLYWLGSPATIKLLDTKWADWYSMLKSRRAARNAKPFTCIASSDHLGWQAANPCVICGRSGRGQDDCRINHDPINGDCILCHHGKSFAPQQGLSVGAVITGTDGREWAFCGTQNGPLGGGRVCSLFRIHQPKMSAMNATNMPDAEPTNSPVRILNSNPPEEKLNKSTCVQEAVESSVEITRKLREGIALISKIPSATQRIIAFEKLRGEVGLRGAFNQALAADLAERSTDKGGSLMKMMEEDSEKGETDWVVQMLAARGSLMALGGDKGEGKTTLCYDIAQAVASGKPAFGELEVQQSPVLIYQCDENKSNFKKKMKRMGIDQSLPIFVEWSLTPFMIHEMRRRVEETSSSLVIIDSVTTVLTGTGAKASDPEYALFVYELNRLAEELNISIIILVHLRKPANGTVRTGVTKDDFLGTSILTAAASDVFAIWKDRSDDAFPDQFVLRCLGKRNCEEGVTWDLQGNKDDFSFNFAGVRDGGERPTEARSAQEQAIDFLRYRPGTPYTCEEIAQATGLKIDTIQRALRTYYEGRNPLNIERRRITAGGRGRPAFAWVFP